MLSLPTLSLSLCIYCVHVDTHITCNYTFWLSRIYRDYKLKLEEKFLNQWNVFIREILSWRDSSSQSPVKRDLKWMSHSLLLMLDFVAHYMCMYLLNLLPSVYLFPQSAALAMDETLLDADQVENLIKFCPTKEEMDLLKVHLIDQSLN